MREVATHFPPVINANYTLVALLPTRWTAIGRFPKVASYDMLAEHLHDSNRVKHGYFSLSQHTSANYLMLRVRATRR